MLYIYICNITIYSTIIYISYRSFLFIISPIWTDDPIWRQTQDADAAINRNSIEVGQNGGPVVLWINGLSKMFAYYVCIIIHIQYIYIYIYYMYCVCRNLELHQLSQLSHQSYMWFTICGGSHRS